MNSVICTLYEGHYHEGAAALINSLYNNDFKGDVFVGYRGEIPFWAKDAFDNPQINWNDSKTLVIKDSIQVHFLPVATNYHFANYKPQFMVKILEDISKDAIGVVYFDPDIVIKCNWGFFERWVSYGVALVHEIVNYDMSANNPTRQMWKELILKSGRKITNELSFYCNSGFCGISRENIEFAKTWDNILTTAINDYNFSPGTFMLADKTSMICGDQDAFNIAAMCTKSPLSEMGPQAMDFLHGGFTMSHANSSPKPWRKRFILSALKGVSASLQEKQFWMNVDGPITIYSKMKIKIKLFEIAVSGLIGRFYQKR